MNQKLSHLYIFIYFYLFIYLFIYLCIYLRAHYIDAKTHCGSILLLVVYVVSSVFRRRQTLSKVITLLSPAAVWNQFDVQALTSLPTLLPEQIPKVLITFLRNFPKTVMCFRVETCLFLCKRSPLIWEFVFTAVRNTDPNFDKKM